MERAYGTHRPAWPPAASVAGMADRVWPDLGRSLTLAGFVAVLALHHVTVGAWDAFFKVQAKYGHAVHNPAGTLGQLVAPVVRMSAVSMYRAEALFCPWLSLCVASLRVCRWPSFLGWLPSTFR